MADITERRVQDWLFHELRSSCALILPNYTPAGWFECDLFAITRAGFTVEHEIKLSLADFKKDAEKSTSQIEPKFDATGERDGYERVHDYKHQRLWNKDAKGPCRFYYVVPEGLLTATQVPRWAGLKTFKTFGGGKRLFFTTQKPAPLLHRKKPDAKIIAHAQSVCYWRFWNLRLQTPGALPSPELETEGKTK